MYSSMKASEPSIDGTARDDIMREANELAREQQLDLSVPPPQLRRSPRIAAMRREETNLANASHIDKTPGGNLTTASVPTDSIYR